MEISYWKSRWQKNNTGWHMNQVYPLLAKLWPKLSFPNEGNILVPLCGKSHDIQWLADQGFTVIGIEASSTAIEQFMRSSQEIFSRTYSYGYTVFSSNSLTLWQGNFLSLPDSAIGAIDAIYDKSSIVALPPAMRKEYAQKILSLCNAETQIFLQSFEYKQEEMNGPPFSVTEGEIKDHFAHHFKLSLLHEESIFDDVEKFQHRGLSSYFLEKVYHLTPK